MLHNRLDVRKETRVNVTGVTDKASEKVDMLMEIIIPVDLQKIVDDKLYQKIFLEDLSQDETRKME